MPRETCQELDRRPTPLGELVLRRRSLPRAGLVVEEVLLDGAYLASSLVHESERALARIPLAEAPGLALDVVVGGLGLGHTATEALACPRVRTLTVIERLPEVIGWLREGRLPRAAALTRDPRVHLVTDDFFLWVAREDGSLYDAILLDVDHSPRAHLSGAHAGFYTKEGLATVRRRLRPGGVFALWSGDVPERDFLTRLRSVFGRTRAEVIRYRNPLIEADEANTVYLAASGPGPGTRGRASRQGAGTSTQNQPLRSPASKPVARSEG